jgi:periplasmic protein TonB
MNRRGGAPHRYPARAAVGCAVVALHVAVIALIGRETFVKAAQETATPIVVDFIEQPLSEPEVPHLSEPKLQSVPTLTIPVPEVSLPAEPASTAITVAMVQAPPSPSAPASLPSAAPPAMSEVAYVRQPAPRYPPESRRSREEGLVVLRVLIDESGHAREINVIRSSGHPRLDEAARNAVERALFKPYMDGGTARAATVMVPVEFSLHHSS